jgi:hypothetical protein
MNQIDKKYREKLPEVIKSFPAQSLSEDEVDAPVTTKKRRSKKLPKLSREGYYPIEEDYSKHWWLNTQSQAARAQPDETFEQLVRRRIGDLRKRETLAQIILVLEILALEASPEFKAAQQQPVESQLEETQAEKASEIQATGNGEVGNEKRPKRKTKKQQDIDLLLDLLLDKLSIWQSIEQDMGADIDTDKKNDSLVENSERLQEQGMLVSFCTDVVIPFFKSRIPAQASQVNKKLGGPGSVSPSKPGKSKPRSADKITRPGDRRARRPLQKTLSDTMGFVRSRPPSLSRSATDSQGMPRLKREASELSLLDIPLARLSHRDSSSQLRHLQSRQVDLTAISAATDAKLQHKAKIERDLKEAINTLKKPNRGQAVKEIADAADQRSLGSRGMQKKTMAPVRKVLQNVRNVQVTATPKHRRSLKAIASPKPDRDEEAEEQHAPSSGDFCIPSSGYQYSRLDMIGAAPAVPDLKPLHGATVIAMTPSRRSQTVSSTNDVSLEELGPTPLKERASQPAFGVSALCSAQGGLSFSDFMRSQMSRKAAPGTPSKGEPKKVALSSSLVKPTAIFATPAKPTITKSLAEDDMTTSPPLVETTVDGPANPDVEERSIYDVLGWND